MERVKDLLDISKTNLPVKEDRRRGFYIENITEEYAINELEVLDLLKYSNENKEVAATYMNALSSRSHSLFIVTVE